MLGVIRDGSGQHTPPLPAPVLLQHSYRPGVMVLIMARTKEGGGGVFTLDSKTTAELLYSV